MTKIIILAGGEATRLWPMNHPPKQFSPLMGEETLFQKTLKRFLLRYPPEDFVIVTQEKFREVALEQALHVEPALATRIIFEKKGENTAPAIHFALQWLEEKGEETDLFLVSPSDHLIAPASLLMEKLAFAESIAKKGFHILFGIYPTHPHTGYGYIVCETEKEITPVECFIEKPSKETALALLEGGNVLWNSGIFLFHRRSFDCSPSPTSIDHALLENAQNLQVVPLSLSWSDVGCWDEIYDLFSKDENKNVFAGDVVSIDTHHCLIYGTERPIVAIDLENLYIIDTKEGLLIAKRGSSQKVAKFSAINRGGEHVTRYAARHSQIGFREDDHS